MSICVLGIQVNCAKTTEPIEMPFGGRLVWARPRILYYGVEIIAREEVLLSAGDIGIYPIGIYPVTSCAAPMRPSAK